MMAFGNKPEIPIAFSTTIIIGAIARMGIVCEVMIHGIRLLSRVRECTMPTASNTPSADPSTKPSNVDESVTQP
ncbi:hypothetical protein D9M72_569200 [compost metagenome]